MRDAYFEWDDEKATSNSAKHDIDFKDARRVFDDLGAIDDLDDTDHYGEERFRMVGMVSGRVITVFQHFTRLADPHYLGAQAHTQGAAVLCHAEP